MQPTPSFRTVRWLRTLNLFLQAILSLTFFAGLNYLALHYSLRFDITKFRSHSISAESRSYLRQLDKPVKVYVTLTRPTDASDDSPLAQAHRDVMDLLREYVYASESNPNGRISVEYIDVFQRGRDAQELGLTAPGPSLVVCGDKRHLVNANELYLIEKGEKKAFLGEQAFTSAILDVSSPNKKKVYFLSGHGEMNPGSSDPQFGLSLLKNELRVRNFEVVDYLDLTTVSQVPEDASLLISAGATNSYSPPEQEMLRQYLATRDSTRAGRLMLLLRPGVASGLEDLLYEWGILADDVLIHDANAASITDSRELMLRLYDPKHEIVKQLVAGQLPVRFGASRSVRVNPSKQADGSLEVTRLIGTSSTAWGERSYLLRRDAEYNPGVDIAGAVLGVAVASERVTAKDKDLPFSVPPGRVVTFGCADFISNNRINSLGNFTLTLSTINWLVDRSSQLDVRTRPIRKFQLSLSQQELLRLRYTLLFALPGAAGLLGLIVYWTRRR